ncbi:MAG: phosphatase PAP2 family protein [archaeon]
MKNERNKTILNVSRSKYFVLINGTLALLFLLIIKGVLYEEQITRADAYINKEIATLWSPALNKTMIHVSSIFDIYQALTLLIVMSGLLLYLKRYRETALFLACMGGGEALVFLLKNIVMRARPENALIDAFGYSFPSGHATVATIFFLSLIYAFKDDIKDKTMKILFIFANVFMIGLIGLSRIYLNVHWFSDVAVGVLLGILFFNLARSVPDVLQNRNERQAL